LIARFDTRGAPFAIALLLALGAMAAGWLVGADNAERALLGARWTARAALPLFLVAYAASSARLLWPGPLSSALVRRRRQWGLAFALAHFIHFVALGLNIWVFGPSRDAETLIGGGLAYGFIALMAITSNDASVRAMGVWWRRLHRVGIHYVWLIFTISYASRIVNPDASYHLMGYVGSSVMLGALTVRLAAVSKRRADSGTATAHDRP
jgi:DMSO/TMAO reductase YedYZ heme-binding membrane subunit